MGLRDDPFLVAPIIWLPCDSSIEFKLKRMAFSSKLEAKLASIDVGGDNSCWSGTM